MSYVIYNDSECHTPKLSTFLAFYPSSAGAPVLPECQFFQSASFARVPAASLPVETKGIRCFPFKPYHILNLTKRTALFQRIKTEITLTQKKMLKYIAIYD
jgi:hypothetical protein